jgi:hypothetical protein
MNKEQQRIAIAEKCGWSKGGRYFQSDEYPDPLEAHGHGAMVPHFNGRLLAFWEPTHTWVEPPNYPDDLNAMHEAEKVLNPCRVNGSGKYPEESEQWCKYFHTLLFVCERANISSAHATATQRSEAFCRVFWPEKFKD